MNIDTPDYVHAAMARTMQNREERAALAEIEADDRMTFDLDDLAIEEERETAPTTSATAASEKQIEFARSLYREIRDLGYADETLLSSIAEKCEAAKGDKGEMSEMIEALIATRDGYREHAEKSVPEGVHVNAEGRRIKVKRSRTGNLYALDLDAEGDQYLGKRGLAGLSADTLADEAEAEAAPANDFPTVPSGRYALDCGNGMVKFYRVQTPTEGEWEGFTFLDAQASDDLHPIRNVAKKRDILTKIAADPKGAAALYGISLGKCGRCGRSLTDDESRARGLGPVCADKGW